ncbi:DUF4231 domain-containing protein [Lentzea sp. NPDC051213]|uniref:DUF4231 domain-containing protein n=1 Tax=Lentzea sp. NPDC051213 TaxID=3364126 RepID=UPI0037B07857
MKRLDQLLFAVSEVKGMALVAASFPSHDSKAWDGWNEKLRPHTRLLNETGGAAAPSSSFSHLSFPDGTAALLRRSARPGDVGRNVAHALVGERNTVAALVPAMATCWLKWLGERPISNRLPDVEIEEFDLATRPPELDDPLLVPILALAVARPSSTYSVIGVPAGQELSVVWALRTLLPDREWTFSTYEQNDAHQPNLPRLIFLPARPVQDLGVQDGRIRVDVREEPRPTDWATKRAEELLAQLHQARVDVPVFVPAATNDVEVEVDDTPTTVIELPHTPEPRLNQIIWPEPAMLDLVHGDGPLPQRLLRFHELAGHLDGNAWHEQICAWIEDRATAPDPFVATLVQAQRAKGYTGFDTAVSRRWLAGQGIASARNEPLTAPKPAARPPVDEATARAMWGKNEAWSRTADHYKERALRYRMGVLGTLAGSAVLTVAAAQFNPMWLPVTSIAVAVLTAALVVAGIWFRAVKEPAERERWTYARMIAEQVKAEVCKYLAGAAPYRDPRAVLLLKQNIDRIERHEKMHELATSTPLIYDLRSYVDNRVREQITYHRATAKRLQRTLQRLRMAEYVFQGMAAALAAVGAVQGYQLAVWAGLLTTIAGAVTAHIAQAGYDRLVARYRRTVIDLEDLQRTLPDQPEPAAQDAFVTGCEQVIARQNDDWLAQLTTSPTKAKADRT